MENMKIQYGHGANYKVKCSIELKRETLLPPHSLFLFPVPQSSNIVGRGTYSEVHKARRINASIGDLDERLAIKVLIKDRRLLHNKEIAILREMSDVPHVIPLYEGIENVT